MHLQALSALLELESLSLPPPLTKAVDALLAHYSDDAFAHSARFGASKGVQFADDVSHRD